MNKWFPKIALALALSLSVWSLAQAQTPAKVVAGEGFVLNPSTPPPLPTAFPGRQDIVLGPDTAPVKLVYNISLDCKACADSWNSVFPKLVALSKEGLLQIHINALYLNEMGWYAATFASCAPAQSFTSAISKMFQEQSSWLESEEILMKTIGSIIDSNHMDPAKVHACLEEKKKSGELRKRRDQDYLYYGLTRFPTYQIWGTPYRFASETDPADMVQFIKNLAAAAHRKPEATE